jgi:hypothetical protein
MFWRIGVDVTPLQPKCQKGAPLFETSYRAKLFPCSRISSHDRANLNRQLTNLRRMSNSDGNWSRPLSLHVVFRYADRGSLVASLTIKSSRFTVEPWIAMKSYFDGMDLFAE